VGRPTRAASLGQVERSLAARATHTLRLRSEGHVLNTRALGFAEGLYKRVVSPTRAAHVVEVVLAGSVACFLGICNIEIRLAGGEARGFDSSVAFPTFAATARFRLIKVRFALRVTSCLDTRVACRLSGVNGRSHDKKSKCAFEHVDDLGGSQR
jgi:hypothetical protein